MAEKKDSRWKVAAKALLENPEAWANLGRLSGAQVVFDNWPTLADLEQDSEVPIIESQAIN